LSDTNDIIFIITVLINFELH